MAYEKQVWNCGDTITADKMNHIEEGIENASSGCGYECTEGLVTLTDESVTTAIKGGDLFAGGKLLYDSLISAPTIKVTFNGTEYTCNKQTSSHGFNYYGADIGVPLGASVDWSEYPFSVSATPVGNVLGTESAGTYQVKIEVYGDVIETSECFDKARGYSCIESVTTYVDETVTFAY